MAKFCEFLYALRKEKNLTQSELAAKLGITNKAVSKWETGEAMPDTAQLLPLSEILGVSVDELLRGERNAETAPPQDGNTREEKEEGAAEESVPPQDDRIIFTSGKDRVEIDSDGSIFINSKRAEREKETYLGKVSGLVCAAIMAIGIIAYVIACAVTGLWHPLWCIPASAGLGCGIVGCLFDIFDRTKRERKWKKGENPYTGALCGIVMCASLIVFLCVASVCNLWHMMWIAPAAGGCACIVIGAVGSVFNHKKEK